MVQIIAPGRATVPFRDVHIDGHRGPAKLRCESEALVRRKLSREAVDVCDEDERPLPDFEFLVGSEHRAAQRRAPKLCASVTAASPALCGRAAFAPFAPRAPYAPSCGPSQF